MRLEDYESSQSSEESLDERAKKGALQNPEFNPQVAANKMQPIKKSEQKKMDEEKRQQEKQQQKDRLKNMLIKPRKFSDHSDDMVEQSGGTRNHPESQFYRIKEELKIRTRF